MKVGDRVTIRDHQEHHIVRGVGSIISLDNMGENYCSVLWSPRPIVKTRYPFSSKEYCNKPCIMVSCESESDLEGVIA